MYEIILKWLHTWLFICPVLLCPIVFIFSATLILNFPQSKATDRNSIVRLRGSSCKEPVIFCSPGNTIAENYGLRYKRGLMATPSNMPGAVNSYQ